MRNSCARGFPRPFLQPGQATARLRASQGGYRPQTPRICSGPARINKRKPEFSAKPLDWPARKSSDNTDAQCSDGCFAWMKNTRRRCEMVYCYRSGPVCPPIGFAGPCPLHSNPGSYRPVEAGDGLACDHPTPFPKPPGRTDDIRRIAPGIFVEWLRRRAWASGPATIRRDSPGSYRGGGTDIATGRPSEKRIAARSIPKRANGRGTEKYRLSITGSRESTPCECQRCLRRAPRVGSQWVNHMGIPNRVSQFSAETASSSPSFWMIQSILQDDFGWQPHLYVV
jgi:hypothetical protein